MQIQDKLPPRLWDPGLWGSNACKISPSPGLEGHLPSSSDKLCVWSMTTLLLAPYRNIRSAGGPLTRQLGWCGPAAVPLTSLFLPVSTETSRASQPCPLSAAGRAFTSPRPSQLKSWKCSEFLCGLQTRCLFLRCLQSAASSAPPFCWSDCSRVPCKHGDRGREMLT